MIVRYGRDIEYYKLMVEARLQWEEEHLLHPEADDNSPEEKEKFVNNAVNLAVATSFSDLLMTIARAVVYDKGEFTSKLVNLIENQCNEKVCHLFSINIAYESDMYDGNFIAEVVPAKTENHQ